MILFRRLISFFRWLIISLGVGLMVGGVGTLFGKAMALATGLRTEHEWLLYLLPVGGLMIVGMYHLAHEEKNQGTNLVLRSIQSGERIPFRVAPLIFCSTVLTHLFGGSAGREGAALQLGGSISGQVGRWLRMDEKDSHTIVLCGMSAAFSALFGTPLTAAIFSMEVAFVGRMQYSALVPCAVSSLTAAWVARCCGILPEAFPLPSVPELSPLAAGQTLLIAMACASVAALMCIVLHRTEHYLKKLLPNPWLRVAAGGAAVIVLTLLLGTRDYLGAGMNIIERAVMEGEVRWEAFLLKIVFTALTLGAGFKGGEIVPSFFVGATLGCLVGQWIGLSPQLSAAIGMAAVFAGVTNCPVSAILVGIELCGAQGLAYYLLAVAVSYLLSGYYGLYHSQRITQSKYADEVIDISVHD